MLKSTLNTILFLGIILLLLSSCGKSYSSSENSIQIDVYLDGPMRLSENEIEKNDSLSILLNVIDGQMPQINFHRLDLDDSIFRDTIEMGFFNGLFEELIDINDMKDDLSNKVFGPDLKAFLTISTSFLNSSLLGLLDIINSIISSNLLINSLSVFCNCSPF
jgi:hypothetical protein